MTSLLRALLAALVLAPVAAHGTERYDADVAGYAPSLNLAMTDATTGQRVTAADFRGKVTMLYLGYTQCPDTCPLTLEHVAAALREIGADAADVRFLFVTVDPVRDTLPVLKAYTAAFGPDFVGLRGDADAIARLARRFRLAYSVTPATATHPYEVTHSAAIYVFDRDGHARRLLDISTASGTDIARIAADLRRVLRGDGG